MAEPSAAKSLPSLAWPLVISFTMRSLLTSIDIPYGAMLGDSAVAAIGLFFPLEFLFIACWVGASTALTSHLSHAMGERHEGRVAQLVQVTGRLAAALMAVFLALAALVWLLSDRLGLEPAVAADFGVYAPLAMAGIATFGFWSVVPDSIVKAHHDTVSTMIAGLISGVTNLGLNTLFVLGFGWGIVGIALATGLARTASLTYALYRARRLERARKAAWTTEAPPRARRAPRATFTSEGLFSRPYAALLALGIPSALTFSLKAAEGFVVNAVLTRLEQATAAIAAYAIYHRASLLMLMPVFATGVAVLPFMARAVGEGRYDEVRHGLRQAFLLSAGYLLLITAPLCVFAAEPIAALLGNREETRELATLAIRYGVPLAALASAPFALCRPAFEALQRGTPGLVMGALRYLVLSVPLALLGLWLAARTGAEPFLGVLAGLIGGTAIVSAVFTVWLVRTVRVLGREEPA